MKVFPYTEACMYLRFGTSLLGPETAGTAKYLGRDEKKEFMLLRSAEVVPI
jgi:hypothetical protein